MNSRQKIVQQKYLNNEKAVLKLLNKTYTDSLNTFSDKISKLQFDIDGLTEEYEWADNAEDKAIIKSRIQSKIYHQKYQQALQKKLGGILNDLHDKAYDNIADYLKQSYEDGFLGTLYDIQGQGIPLMFPIDQEAVTRAVQIDSKISKNLYTKVGENVNALKKSIAAEVSRGIATSMTYAQVAQQIKLKMTGTYSNKGGAMARAMTIARTEGHRVQIEAGMDACYKAKEMGCDVVKQWDSTLDGKTRHSHRKVDGEIRELDDKFSNNLMFPGDSKGGAGEVVNCRCALLQRAKWALDEGELQTLKERAEFYGIDKTENFEDYKQKYLKAVEKIESNEKSGLNVNYDCEIAKEFGKDYYDALHEKVVNSPNQELAKVWKQYEADIKVGDAQYKGHEFCRGSTIYVNGAKDAKGSSWQNPYQVTFHESGHAIDSLAKQRVNSTAWGARHYSSAYKDGLFPQTIKGEVNDWVNDVAKQMKQEFKEHAGDIDYFIKKNYISKYDKSWYESYPSELKFKKAMAYSAVEREISSLSTLARADLSDILEGATDGKIQAGFGHGKKYWKDRTFDGLADGLATESFAEMVDSTFTNPESLEAIKKYLPKSYNVFEEMIKDLIV